MNIYIRLLVIIPFLSLLSACVQTTPQADVSSADTSENSTQQKPKAPKNIIIMVGDGMGTSQITAGMYVNGNKLNLERIRHIGFIKTHSASDLITDSAAGATAFSCGVKSYNGAIGVDADTVAKETILENLQQKGYATGVVSTSSIQHATPASFYAHQPNRKMFNEISLDLAASGVDFFAGGGRKYLAEREDGQDLIAELEGKGYTIAASVEEVKGKAGKAGVFIHDEEPPRYSEGRGDYLPAATQEALDRLSTDEKGFFMIVEGSQIDWGGHAEDGEYIINEMIDFDNAIGKVLDFAEQDGETLVVITADHETGGFAITGGKIGGPLETGFVNDYHSGTIIPVFAYGPGAENFQGIYENTDIYNKMMSALDN